MRHGQPRRAVAARGCEKEFAPRSPWQNAYVERLIGTIRRDCLDHVLIFGEQHLRWSLAAYAEHYNKTRTHLALNKDAPLGPSRAMLRGHYRDAASVRIASPLRANMIFGRDNGCKTQLSPRLRIN
jgi:transposase InsO family protein